MKKQHNMSISINNKMAYIDKIFPKQGFDFFTVVYKIQGTVQGFSAWKIPYLFWSFAGQGSKIFPLDLFKGKSKFTLLLLLFAFTGIDVTSQVYVEKKSRHRFAQLNLGLDVQSSFGGSTKYINEQGNTQSMDLKTYISPRIIIGGTHFWGHADFYIAIPLYNHSRQKNSQETTTYRGAETVFKFYPWRIENNKIRPFIGSSIAPFYFEQSNKNFKYPRGQELNLTSFPLLGGFTFNSKNQLLEVGVAWNYADEQNYYISRTQMETIKMPSLYAALSYRFMLETTLSAEKNWESGRISEITKYLSGKGELNGLFLGIGISSAFWLRQSSYNRNTRPYIDKYDTSIMPDFSLGYYMHDPDINVAISYRSYATHANTYGAEQELRRRSFLLEATKYLFDYHGFVPFVGPAISYERLGFEEYFEGTNTIASSKEKFAYGITFGWDIRPTRINSWILRTNLRWYPNLYLDVEQNTKVSFNALEFNFIQLIIYPNRMAK